VSDVYSCNYAIVRRMSQKKMGPSLFHMCHPYAGAMLIFSVFFQFRLLPLPKEGIKNWRILIYIPFQSGLKYFLTPTTSSVVIGGLFQKQPAEISGFSARPNLRIAPWELLESTPCNRSFFGQLRNQTSFASPLAPANRGLSGSGVDAPTCISLAI